VKALVLTREYPPHVYGGAGVHVEYLVRELARLIDVEVRCFGDQEAVDGRLRVRGLEAPAALLAEAPEGLRSTLGTLALDVAFAASSAGADLVHCHTWYAHLGGILCKLLHGLPLVITIHSLEPKRPWKREQIGRGFDLSSWVERTALEMADRILAVSGETRRDVLELFRVEPDRVAVVPNGIDLDEYRPDAGTGHLRRYGVDPDRPYVLFVGRVTRQKGVEHLIRAARHLDPAIPVVLAAGAPDTPEIARETEEAVAELRAVRDGVHWIREMLPRAATIELYSHAGVFCCPSIYEPFGIINLEAMACGTPVVASAVGGITEVVVDGETGRLVPFEASSEAPFGPADPGRFAVDLAAALSGVLADPERRRRMGEAGRRRVEERYAWSAVASQVVEEYRRIAGQPR
jgi:glycogen synthase